MNIGERIKEIRERQGITLLAIANHLGVTEATVQRYESGNIKNLKLDTISKIASFLNINPGYLMGWSDNQEDLVSSNYYNYYSTIAISAGQTITVDGVSDADKINIADSVMGKYAGNNDIYITRVNGESMNKTIPHNSLIAVKPITLSELKDGDIVVYSHDHEYGVKRFLQHEDEIWFRPNSTDFRFRDDIYKLDDVDGLEIHGKVITYIVNLD